MNEFLQTFLNGVSIIDFFIKAFSIVIMLLYFFFSVILIRQVKLMKKLIRIRDGGVLSLLAYLQFVCVILLLAYAIILL